MAQLYIPHKIFHILDKKNFYRNLPIVGTDKLRKRQLSDYVQLYLDDFGIYCNDDEDLIVFEWLKRLYQQYLDGDVLWDDGIQRNADCCFSTGVWIDCQPWLNERGWVNSPSDLVETETK